MRCPHGLAAAVILLTATGCGHVQWWPYSGRALDRLEDQNLAASGEFAKPARGAKTKSKQTRRVQPLLPGYFFIDVRLNQGSRSIPLLVDTGSRGGVLLAPQVARKAGVRLRPDQRENHRHAGLRSMDAATRPPGVAMRTGVLDRLSVAETGGGALAFVDVPVRVFERRAIYFFGTLPSYMPRGFVGMDFLEQFVVEFDYVHETLSLHLEAPSDLPSESVPMHRDGEGLPTVYVAIGPEIWPARVDTGAEGPLLVPTRLWNRLGLGQVRKTEVDFELGPWSFDAVPAQHHPGDLLVITSDVFGESDVSRAVMDIEASRLYLERDGLRRRERRRRG
jgi:predicted aspartyl protease